MKVKYFEGSTFLLENGESKLLTNPFDKSADLLEKVSPTIVVLSHEAKSAKTNGFFTVVTPGEYEVKDIFVYGYNSLEDEKGQTSADVFMFEVEGIHFGFIDKSVVTAEQSILSEIGIVDVLFVPLEKESGMSLAKTIELIRKIEPFMIIPMDYDEATLKEFVNTMGINEAETVKDLKLSKSDFADEEMPLRCVVFEK